MNPIPPPEKTLTPEERTELVAKQIKFYEEKLPLVRVKSEYETLMTNIEEQQLRRSIAIRDHATVALEAQQAVDKFNKEEKK